VLPRVELGRLCLGEGSGGEEKRRGGGKVGLRKERGELACEAEWDELCGARV
jgi:hypothetical protein